MYIYVWGDTVIPIALEEKGPSIKSGEEKPFIHFIIDTSYISSNIFSYNIQMNLCAVFKRRQEII